MDKGVLNACFEKYASGDYDSLLIDRTVGSPAPVRKNIYEVIKTLPSGKAKKKSKKVAKKPVKRKKKKKVVLSSSEESSSESESSDY